MRTLRTRSAAHPGCLPLAGQVLQPSLRGLVSCRWIKGRRARLTPTSPRALEKAAVGTVLQAVIPPAAANVKLYYKTGWKKAWVHGCVTGGSWQDYPLLPVTSAPGVWLAADVPLTAAQQQLEFVVTDFDRQHWDKLASGGNYKVEAPGTYTLANGTLAPVVGRPVMVVSDLDGTMVGDDASTGAFKRWWEAEAVVRGGVLAYNTGRSLESFKQLLDGKRHCLAHPDVLISAVGTKIYKYDGSSWSEDAGWTRMLDAGGWSVKVVRDAAYRALAAVGKDAMHFRPPEEQNDHKVTCGVAVARLPEVLRMVEGTLREARVTANLITSGTGDWRFLDLVPKGAGKLEAMSYVRRSYGFADSDTVACGDSGNDILMLAGTNPAIVVGNAQPDLLDWVRKQQQQQQQQQQQGGGNGGGGNSGKQRLLVAKKKEALGILEGLEYFGFK